MPTPFPENRPKESPFWQLLADAEEVQIREVEPSTDDSLRDFAPSRAFLVRVKTPPPVVAHVAPEPTPEPAPTAETPAKTDRATLLGSGEVLIGSGEYLLARHLFSFLIKENPRDAEAAKGLAICLFHLGDRVLARKLFQDLVETGLAEEGLFWLARLALDAGEDAEALRHFQGIRNPEALGEARRFEFHKDMGNCFTRAGDYDAAEPCYLRALTLRPASDAVYANLGTLEVQRNRADRAETHFRKALELNAANPRARCGMGFVLFARGAYGPAADEFFAALDADPASALAVHYLLAIGLLTGELTRTRDRLGPLAEKHPQNPDLQYALAVTLYKCGDTALARDRLRIVLGLNPDHAKARRLIDEIDRGQGDPT